MVECHGKIQRLSVLVPSTSNDEVLTGREYTGTSAAADTLLFPIQYSRNVHEENYTILRSRCIYYSLNGVCNNYNKFTAAVVDYIVSQALKLVSSVR